MPDSMKAERTMCHTEGADGDAPAARLTVAIPFYNCASTLADSIRSVLAQTFCDYELLLMDDGSADGSLAIAQAVRDPRVRVHSDGVNRGLVYRLNQIVDLCQTPYLARMDADDMIHPERLAKQMALLESDPTLDLVDTGVCSLDRDGVPVGLRALEDLCTDPAHVLAYGMLVHASVIGRRDWFLAHRYDPQYVRAEDHELWCRTCRVGRYGRVREPLYLVREGCVNVANYLRSLQTQREIYRVYGPESVGRVQTARLIAMSYLKGWVYRLFSAIGLLDVVVNRRNRPLPKETEAAFRETIAEIRRVDLSAPATVERP